MTGRHLVERLRIPTSGARAVEAFTLAGQRFLVIPQLALDVPGSAPSMGGGDSNTEALVLRKEQDGYVEHQRLHAPGGEDAEFFRIDDRSFLAVASIRRGAGPYDFAVDSVVHEWNGEAFVPFQAIPTVAAKQWRYFTVEGRHFLALAQGVAGLPSSRPSTIYEWDPKQGRFLPFQEIPSTWGYDVRAFTMRGHQFLAHADHAQASVLYRWDGRRFVAHQTLADRHGRAFAPFEVDGEGYLACALLQSESKLLRWDGAVFVEHQALEGLGARQLVVVRTSRDLYLVRINFILGDPHHHPTTALDSQLYRWEQGRLAVVETFRTEGGTDAVAIADADHVELVVSNSLSANVRFATDTIIYRFHG